MKIRIFITGIILSCIWEVSAQASSHMQKGHAVSFADLDNDGNEDIYIKMGGAYTVDAYENSFYLNPAKPIIIG